MSRHRYVRNMRDEYDDDDDDDDTDGSASLGTSQNSYGVSPSVSQYMVRRGGDTLKTSVSATAKLDDDALLKDMIPQVYAVVDPRFPKEEVVEALRDSEYSVEQAVRVLLEQEAYRDFDAAASSGQKKGGVDVFDMEEDEEPKSVASTKAAPSTTATAGGAVVVPKTKAPSEIGKAITGNPKNPPAKAPWGKQPMKTDFAFDTPSPDDAALAKRQQPPEKKIPLAVPAAAAGPPPVVQQKSPKKGALKISSEDELRKSASDLNKSSGAVANNPLKQSSSGGGQAVKIAATLIRPDKKTKQVLDEIDKQSAGTKQRLNMVVIGHVDAGKSTLMGHLLHLMGSVDDRQMHKMKTTSEREGKGSFAYAWVMDASEEERKRGVTIDVGQGHFETQTKSITLLDAPGHLDFVPNMIVGTSQADVALLVIDCTPGAFEAGFGNGGQTKEHALLARSLGVKQMCVVMNKLDSVSWSQDRYNTVREQVSSFLTKNVGFKLQQLQFVPCSGWKGVNVKDCKEAALLQWWKGSTLLGCIENFTVDAKKDALTKPLRFYVTDVLGRGESGISGLGLCGKVEAGIVCVGDSLLLMPLRQLVTVKSLRLQSGATPQYARDGDTVDMGVVGQEDSAFFVGDVLCDPQHPIPVVRKFRAQIVVFEPPRPVLKGDDFVLHMHSISAQCHISRLRSILDKKTGEVAQRKPRLLPHKSTAIVDIRLERALCMELFSDCQQFGRFLLRANSKTVAAGLITCLISLDKEGDDDVDVNASK